MSTSNEPAAALPGSIQHWLEQGESLYCGMVREFQSLQDRMAELEGSIRQKMNEVNQIAQVLGKPPMQNGKLAAELVTHYSPELRTNDEALRIRLPATARPVAAARPVRTVELAGASAR